MDRTSTPPQVLRINPVLPEPELVLEAAQVLKEGGTAILPTDTVYGIGLAVMEGTNPRTLAQVKQRSEEKNIPLLVARADDLKRYGSNVSPYAEQLALQHWPGALTLIVRARCTVPSQFVAPDGSIALRMPAHPLTLALLEAVEVPLATSSANLSGNAPASSVYELNAALTQKVSVIIDGGKVPCGRASTVVSCLGAEPVVLRQGPITIGEVGE